MRYLIVLILLCCGCTSRLGDFTLLATRNIDISRMAEYKRSGIRAKGEDSKPIIIVFPAGVPSAEEAADRAVDVVPGGVALIDGAVYAKWFYIPYLFGQNSYVVEGEVLVDMERTTPEELAETKEKLAEAAARKKERLDARREAQLRGRR